jgi:FixJ family two-component response regulator
VLNEAPLIAVIDDDESLCRAVARMLGADGYRVRTYTTARDYLDETDVASPTCVLVDIRMPDVDGMSLMRTMHEDESDIPAVFMTATGDVPTVVSALKTGAIDLLAKPFSASDLHDAITRATASAELTRTQRMATASMWKLVSRLTPREAEVCALVSRGLLNKNIAAVINTREKTVKVHRGRVMQKLQLSSVADLVRLVDAVQTQAARHSIRLDSVEIHRPRAVEIMLDVLAREAARKQAAAHLSS